MRRLVSAKQKQQNASCSVPCSLWMEWSWTGFCTCSRRCISGTSWRSERRLPSYTPSTVSPATCTGSPGNPPLTSGSNGLLGGDVFGQTRVEQFGANKRYKAENPPMIRSTNWYCECRSSISSSWQLKYSISSGEAAFNLERKVEHVSHSLYFMSNMG